MTLRDVLGRAGAAERDRLDGRGERLGRGERPWNGVPPIRPGETALTRMPCGASSFA